MYTFKCAACEWFYVSPCVKWTAEVETIDADSFNYCWLCVIPLLYLPIKYLEILSSFSSFLICSFFFISNNNNHGRMRQPFWKWCLIYFKYKKFFIYSHMVGNASAVSFFFFFVQSPLLCHYEPRILNMLTPQEKFHVARRMYIPAVFTSPVQCARAFSDCHTNGSNFQIQT